MKETYQKLFEDYTSKIDEFMSLMRKAVKGDTEAKSKINEMIAQEDGKHAQAHLRTVKNVFERILDEIAETKEKTSLSELRARYVAEMNDDFDFFAEGKAKMRAEYGEGLQGIFNRMDDLLFLNSENKETYQRVCDISAKYPRLDDLEEAEHWEDFKARAEAEEAERQRKISAGELAEEDSDCDEEEETIGDVIGNIVCAPLYALANGINWLADGINDIALKIPVAG